MEKKLSGLNRTLFDVAGGPFILLLFGIPLLIVILVIVLTILAVRLILKAHARNKAQDEKNNGLK